MTRLPRLPASRAHAAAIASAPVGQSPWTTVMAPCIRSSASSAQVTESWSAHSRLPVTITRLTDHAPTVGRRDGPVGHVSGLQRAGHGCTSRTRGWVDSKRHTRGRQGSLVRQHRDELSPRALAVSHSTGHHGADGLNPVQICAKPERHGRPAGSRAHFLQLLPQTCQ